MASTDRREFESARHGVDDHGSARPARITVNPPASQQPAHQDTTPVAPIRPDLTGLDRDDGRSVEDNRPYPSRRGRTGRRILLVCALILLAGVAYVGVTLAQVWSTGRADATGPADAIVVMGAAQYDGRPSPQLAARLDHVVEIWPDVVAPLVVVTGGNIPGDRFTEAEASAAYLVERGIPESAVVMENDGSTTYESMAGVAALLAERDMDEVIVVTDPYHALRSKLIAEEVGLNAAVSSTDTSVVTGGDSFVRHLEEAGGVAVGRIIGFERLTDIAG